MSISFRMPAADRGPFGRALGVAVVAFVLSGCSPLGPDFVRPLFSTSETYVPQQPSEVEAANIRGGNVQTLVRGMDIPGQWWTLFKSEELDTLIKTAFAEHPTIGAATAALRSANEQLAAQRASLLPTLQLGLDGNQNQTPANIAPVPVTGQSAYGLLAGRLQVTYLLDVWGAKSRRVESAQALASVQCFQVQAAYLTLASSIAVAAIEEAALREELRAKAAIVNAQRQTLDVVTRQTQAGLITGQEVAAQRAALAQVESTLPAIRKALSLQRNQLAVLSGALPNAPPSQEFQLADFQLPRELPLTLPSRLLEHRPDVRAAIEQLRSSSALIGVARANQFPQFMLSASAAPQTLALDGLLSPVSLGANFGLGILQTLFDGGALAAKRRQAVADFEKAQADYRLTVLNAFREVADALRSLEYDAQALAAAVNAERAAEESLAVARRRLELGDVTYTAVLTAELLYQQTLMARVRAQANRLLATASLLQALGGGWWNTQAAACAGTASGPTGEK